MLKRELNPIIIGLPEVLKNLFSREPYPKAPYSSTFTGKQKKHRKNRQQMQKASRRANRNR